MPCDVSGGAFVFISYAHENSDRVFPVIETLAGEGYQIWYDKGINISSTWTDEIANAIIKCDVDTASSSDTYIREAFCPSCAPVFPEMRR
jgi:hypothetical protein